MKTLYMIFYNLKRNFRCKTTLIYMLLLPIVLIFILGSALKSEFTPSSIDKAVVYYYSEDTGEISKNFERYIKSDDLKDIIQVKEVKNKNEGLNNIKSNERSSFIYIDSNFTKKIMKGSKTSLNVYNQRHSIQTEVVKNVIEGFSNGVNAVFSSISIGGKGEYVNSSNITDSSINIDGKIPRAIDYYAVTMLVMILMYGAFYGSSSISELFKETHGIRMQVSPTSKLQILFTSLASSILAVFLEGLILIFTSKYVFKANYGNNMPLIIFITFSMTVFTNFIGMTLAILSKRTSTTDSIINILVVVCTMISGGYVKLSISNPIYNAIIKFVPNNMAQSAMFNLVYGSNMNIVTSSIISIYAGILICFIISLIAGRKAALQ